MSELTYVQKKVAELVPKHVKPVLKEEIARYAGLVVMLMAIPMLSTGRIITASVTEPTNALILVFLDVALVVLTLLTVADTMKDNFIKLEISKAWVFLFCLNFFLTIPWYIFLEMVEIWYLLHILAYLCGIAASKSAENSRSIPNTWNNKLGVLWTAIIIVLCGVGIANLSANFLLGVIGIWRLMLGIIAFISATVSLVTIAFSFAYYEKRSVEAEKIDTLSKIIFGVIFVCLVITLPIMAVVMIALLVIYGITGLAHHEEMEVGKKADSGSGGLECNS